MEDKIYRVLVEKFNRVQICVTGIVICFGTNWLATFLESGLGIKIRGQILMLAVFALCCFLLTKYEKYFLMVEELRVTFRENTVEFKRAKTERTIRYSDITEVEKIMVISHYHSEKGYYRIKVKNKGRTYTIYSGEDQSKQLDFEEIDLSKIYDEFKSRGVKCC